MSRLHQPAAPAANGLRRREFLGLGGLGLLGAAEARALHRAPSGRSVIWINLVGAPGQLDTFDPKPEAPREIRGPYATIPTNAPGIQVSEILPRLARIADRYALLRTLHYDGPAVHAAGHQWLQTGAFVRRGQPAPHVGCLAASQLGAAGGLPPHVALPQPIGDTGSKIHPGQDAGRAGACHDPLRIVADPASPEDWGRAIDDAVRQIEQSRDARLDDEDFREGWDAVSTSAVRRAFDLRGVGEDERARYGRTRFGQSCLLAGRLTRAGVRFVTLNMFETIFGGPTWDSHGAAPFSKLSDYADSVGPAFDQGLAALLEELDREGRLESTMVVASGEFGRTPKINPLGGRDHWTGCWSALVAGGGMEGGQAIGESDAWAAEPHERPLHASKLRELALQSLGLDPTVS